MPASGKFQGMKFMTLSKQDIKERDESRKRLIKLERGMVRLETMMTDVHKSVMGNGRPGLIQDMAAAKADIAGLKNSVGVMTWKKAPTVEIKNEIKTESNSTLTWIFENRNMIYAIASTLAAAGVSESKWHFIKRLFLAIIGA